ncbi:hypothetical protein ACTFIR_005521 [Dictyostelium discoideum]
MNILKSVLIFLSLISICFSQANPRAIAIQNLSNGTYPVATVGELYFTSPGYSPIAFFDNSEHIGSTNNAYNNLTKIFYCMVNILTDPDYISLERINTTTSWNIFAMPYYFLKSEYNFSSLASDQSASGYNLFATFEITGDKEAKQFSIGKISAESQTMKVIDKIPGVFQSSTFDANPGVLKFYVISNYQQKTYINTYSSQGAIISRDVYTYNLYMQLQPTGVSSNMFYCNRDKNMYFTNNLLSNNNQNSVSEAPGLFVVSPSTLSLNDTGLTDVSTYRSGTISVISMGCDLNQPVIYSIGTTQLLNLYPFGFTLDTINLSTNQISSANFASNILNFYVYQ